MEFIKTNKALCISVLILLLLAAGLTVYYFLTTTKNEVVQSVITPQN